MGGFWLQQRKKSLYVQTKKGIEGNCKQITLLNRTGLAKVIGLHGDPATTRAGIFHGRQFIPAHVFGIRFGGAAKTALGRISTGIAQMSRFTCNRSAIFTRVCHIFSPFND